MSKSSHDPKVHRPEIEGRETHDDDLIVAPKGKNKTRFMLTFLLIIFLLTMFTVSDQFVDMFTGQAGRGSAFLTWTDPTGDRKSLTVPEFTLEKQALAKVFSILTGGQDRERADDDTAFFVVMSDAAEHAGVRVTDGELRKLIESRFPGGVGYSQTLHASRITHPEFEGTLRRLMAVDRYQSLISAPLATAKPSVVESLWKARHQEHAFDYIEPLADVLRTEAEAGLPADAELETWFNALPEHKREPFRRLVAVAAELAVFPLEGEHSADLLFAKYPRPADEDADAAAREYYEGYTFMRFRNRNLPTDRQPTQEDFFRPFDDVKDVAKREAVIYRSLGDWRTSLVTRTDAGETIDLAAEAASIGLVAHSQSNTATAAEWAALDVPWTSRNLSEYITGMPEVGKFYPAVSVDEKALIVGRTLAKEEPRMPPFSELKPKVADEWLRQRMSELAIVKLDDVRKKIGTWPDPSDPAAATFVPEVDEATFASVVGEAGYQVQHRDYQERAKSLADTPAHTYLRGAGQLYSSKVSAVPKPEIARDGKNAYLVRIAGLRDADTATMSPGEFQALGDQAIRESITDFRNRTFVSTEFLKERYGVQLLTWEANPPGS